MIKCTDRRSISSVIGGAVFLVLFISGFTVFMFAIQVSEDRFSEQLSASFEETLRGKESFTIAPSINNAKTLFVQVTNTGTTPLNILDVFVVNVLTGDILEYEINFKDAHVAANESRAIFASYAASGATPLITNIADGTYDVKVVTELGTVVVQKLIVPLDPLFTDMFTIPKNLGSGQNVTVTLFVYNRGNATVFDVSPVLSTTDMTDPATSLSTSIGPIPSTINSLEPQESVFFAWEQQVVGAIGTQIAYNNTASGTDGASGDTVTGNYDEAHVEFVPQAISLLQRPEIRVLIPSPSGEEDGTALKSIWGINVLNPTSFAFDVSRIVITASPNTPDVEIFSYTNKNSNCGAEGISPATGTWNCPASNVLVWTDVSTPISVAPKSAQAWIAKTTPGTLGSSNDNDPATNIFVTVYSTYGPATEIAIPTSMYAEGEGSIANLLVTNRNETAFIIDTDEDPDVLLDSSILGNLQEIASASTFYLNMTLIVLSDNVDSGLASGRLIINIPSGFDIVSISDVDSALSATLESPTTFSDGSKQLRATFTNLGLTAAIDKLTATIGLKAPIVTTNATYTVIGIAEGILQDSSEPFGPLVEFPLQVLDVSCVGTPPVCP